MTSTGVVLGSTACVRTSIEVLRTTPVTHATPVTATRNRRSSRPHQPTFPGPWANTHGDIVTVVELPSAGTAATGINGWNNYDEYGSVTGTTAATGIVNYGWLGAKQRAVSGASLTLMGVRIYNPTTGQFTSVDPVSGGNANRYTYPSDPINSFDLDGQKRCWRWDWRCQVRKGVKAGFHGYSRARRYYESVSVGVGAYTSRSGQGAASIALPTRPSNSSSKFLRASRHHLRKSSLSPTR